MACCCLPHFDLGWESPAAPCKSQRCWQPKSAAAHSPGEKICEKGAELSLPICFLFSLHLFLHLLSVRLCHKIHVWKPRNKKNFPFPFPISPSSRRRQFLVSEHLLKKGFSPAAPPFCSERIIWCQVSSAAIAAPIQHCNVQRDAW